MYKTQECSDSGFGSKLCAHLGITEYPNMTGVSMRLPIYFLSLSCVLEMLMIGAGRLPESSLQSLRETMTEMSGTVSPGVT